MDNACSFLKFYYCLLLSDFFSVHNVITNVLWAENVSRNHLKHSNKTTIQANWSELWDVSELLNNATLKMLWQTCSRWGKNRPNLWLCFVKMFLKQTIFKCNHIKWLRLSKRLVALFFCLSAFILRWCVEFNSKLSASIPAGVLS